MQRIIVGLGLGLGLGCGKSDDKSASPARSAPSGQPSPGAPGSVAATSTSTATSTATPTPTIDLCSLESVVSEALGEPFHAKPIKVPVVHAVMHIGQCDFMGPETGEVVSVSASKEMRKHIEGFAAFDGSKPVAGVGEVAYFISVGGTFQLHAYKDGIIVHLTYGNAKLDPGKIQSGEKTIANAVFAKL
jgi:hypothetical protein